MPLSKCELVICGILNPASESSAGIRIYDQKCNSEIFSAQHSSFYTIQFVNKGPNRKNLNHFKNTCEWELQKSRQKYWYWLNVWTNLTLEQHKRVIHFTTVPDKTTNGSWRRICYRVSYAMFGIGFENSFRIVHSLMSECSHVWISSKKY